MSATVADNVHVTISVDTLSVEQANFGTPMLIGYHSATANRVDTYSGNTGLTSMVTDGHATTDPLYLMATALLSQSPKVEEFKVGRLALSHTQDTEIEITDATEDNIVTVTITDETGSDYAMSYTILAAATTTTVATAVAALINANVTNLTATPTAENIRCVADNAGDVFYYTNNANCSLTDLTPDPGIATDLAAIELADSDWYGAALDVNSYAILDAAAAWIEANDKIMVAWSQDSVLPTSGTTGCIGTELASDSRVRTALLYTHGPDNPLSDYGNAAWLGKCLPADPGSQTWNFKTLSGVGVSNLTSTHKSELEDKYANWYITKGGVNVTAKGWASDGTWIDQTRFTDWLRARIEEAVFALMAGSNKLPYDDDGIELIRGAIYSVYEQGASNGGCELQDFEFSALASASQASADRANRIMRDIQFGGTLTGAMHEVYITGNLV